MRSRILDLRIISRLMGKTYGSSQTEVSADFARNRHLGKARGGKIRLTVLDAFYGKVRYRTKEFFMAVGSQVVAL